MFKIYDGRKQFYQWDLDRKIIVNDNSINQVHFCNRTDECSLVCEVYEENGKRLVNVPNVLLQADWRINVYGYDKNYTKHSAAFEVVKRTKPEGYVYTETEILNYNTLLEKINNIEGGNVDLSNYYTKPEVDEKLSDVEVDVDLSGYYNKEETDTAIKEAVEAIDVPEVDLSNYYNKEQVDEKIETIELTPGPQGEPGKDGKDGANGQDGKDYVLTDADKQEIAASVNLEEYAKKSDIPDTTGFTTEEEVIALIAEYGGSGGGDLPASEEGAF